MQNQAARNISDFRNIMKEYGIDYYIIPTSDPHMSEYINPYYESRRFLSGFTGDSGTLLVGIDDAYLWTDGRFYTQALDELKDTGIKLMRAGMQGVPTISEFLKDKLKKPMCLGAFGETINVSFAQKLKSVCKLNDCKFKTKYDLVDLLWENRPDIKYQNILIKGNAIYGESVKSKLEKVRKFLHDKAIDAYFFSKLDEIMYLYNIRGNDIPYNPVAVSYAYIDMDKAILFVDESVIDGNLINYALENGFVCKPYKKVKSILKKYLEKNIKVGTDYDSLNYSIYKMIKKKAKLINCESVIEVLKAVKNSKEIEQLVEYFRLDSAALTNAIAEIHLRLDKGFELNENDVSNIIYNHRSKIAGFLSESFPTIAAYGSNGAIIHYVPSASNCAKLEKRGLLVIDSGAQYECATTDVTRTIALGELTQKEKAAFTDVTMGMLYLMNATFAEGCSGRNLDILARERLWKRGLNFNHGTGHGVGCCLNVHEGPQSIRYKFNLDDKKGILKPGMLITDEPGFYEPNEFGIRSENTLLVINKANTEYGKFFGFKSFTVVPLDISCFDVSLLDDNDIRLINEYQKMAFEAIKELLDVTTLEWLNGRLYL